MKIPLGAIIPGALLAGVVWLNAASPLAADVNLPQPPRGKGASCVEPTEQMRRNHMDFLVHQRRLTVRHGVRTPRHSLVGCLECHARRDHRGQFIAVDAPGEFCQGCHAFTAVTIDCFECHAAKPDGRAAAMTVPGAPPPGRAQ